MLVSNHTQYLTPLGCLGYLEELRDDIVIKLVRFLQGACYGHMRRKEFERRKKQR